MLKKILSLICFLCFSFASTASDKTAQRVYLSGKGTSDAINWQFKCSDGRKCGQWHDIPVPSNWEQQGFGHYNYGHDLPAEKHDEVGTYKTQFFAPNDWKNKHVRLVFEGSMTQTSVFLNGEKLGVDNMGGYVPFRHDLSKTKALKYGAENELTVIVKKKPDNDSLDHAERKADYWVFGGIYRPVYLEVQNKSFINRVAIDAKANGDFKMDVFPQLNYITKFKKTPPIYVDEVYAQIQTINGENVGEPMSIPMLHGSGRVRMQTQIKNAKTWSPEYPNLYQVRVELRKDGQTVSAYQQKFGFRTFEVRRQDGFYLNGQKILVKGVNRNVFDPITGRAIDKEKAWKDAREIKSANINLVRSHLPPTTEFMEACDELGLMVITELTNWHDPWIDTPIARNIAYEIVTKYQNHPSVILWANGNESGFNLEIDDLYHLYDLQDRHVIHPWTNFEGIETFHYPEYDEFLEKLSKPTVYLPTEFLHGLYDGGHGAGLQDYWQAMKNSKTGAGGVLWCWADAAVARSDMEGKLDTHGNKSSDGMVGPFGQKEASYYAVRELWSPIQIKTENLNSNFDGDIRVKNEFYQTNLQDCQFRWQLVKFDQNGQQTIADGHMAGADIGPGTQGELTISLPTGWQTADALQISATDPHKNEVMQWSLPIDKSYDVFKQKNHKITVDKNNPFNIAVGEQHWQFSPQNGQLLKASINKQDSGLGKGPSLHAATLEQKLNFNANWQAQTRWQGNAYQIVATNDKSEQIKWTITPQAIIELEYQFAAIDQKLTYLAVGFELPENQVSSKEWVGKGPYRVWANRLQGVQFGHYQNDYNDKLTGLNMWGQAEFKGIFSDVRWMKLNLKSQQSLLISQSGSEYLGVLRPSNSIPVESVHPKKLNRTHESPIHAVWNYPTEGGLHLFHKIPGIGTKFMYAHEAGPQGEPQKVSGPIKGQVKFQLAK
ncbi:glycoside hydrolase family 2 [Gayadomonas joobiniege]|uniref:glycoside hydrolase family 2 n=1 Tax=Gayadomonas joobiniege TaxID=1234606 RepID=UPI00036EA5E2|nr:glycoside hydrolase family 2 [Gayadomonas joobiniege]